MQASKLRKLELLHSQAEALVSALVNLSQYADFGSDEAHRLDQLIAGAVARAERRHEAKMALTEHLSKIPTDISLGYVSVDGFLKHCTSGPGRKLPHDFKEWSNSSLNRIMIEEEQ